MSFPPGTEMFQFPGFAFIPLLNSRNKYLLMISVGPKTACTPSPNPKRPLPARARTQRLEACAASPSRVERASSEQQRSKVGFPIRRFTDQSLFAAPHDLSQRTTSFIASQRQGIHQIPLRHLIALIAKARFRKDGEPTTRDQRTCVLRCLSSDCPFPNALGVEKTSFASNASGDLSGQAPNPRLVASRRTETRDRRRDSSRPPFSVIRIPAHRMRFLFTMSDIGRRRTNDRGQNRPLPASRPSFTPERFGAPAKLINCIGRIGRKTLKRTEAFLAATPIRSPSSDLRPPKWWSQTGSNRRPHACKARALPTELWPRRKTEDRRQRDGRCLSSRLSADSIRRPEPGGPGRT